MPDPVLALVTTLQLRGTTLVAVDGRLRYRAPRGSISDADKQLLAENVELVDAILNPDLNLPDELVIPAHVPNTVEAIARCVDSQRTRRAA